MKKISSFYVLLLFMIVIISISGCEETQNRYNNENNDSDLIYNRYYSDPLYCESSTDCTSHIIDCKCGCPEAVNVYNKRDVNCNINETPQGKSLGCAVECPREFEVICYNNKCVLDEKILITP